jgi:hypothetical protein
MRNPETSQQTADDGQLVTELMRDFGFANETELQAALDGAEAWARKHRLARIGVTSEGDAGGYEAKIGPEQREFVHRYTVGVMDEAGALESPDRRGLLAAATALFAFSHPMLRRYVEAGECEQK